MNIKKYVFPSAQMLLLMGLSCGISQAQVDCAVTPLNAEATDVLLGNGTPGSVTTAMIQNALNAGGVIRFDLGPSPAVIPISAELVVTRAAVLDGGGLVTLDGQGARRIVRITNPNNQFYTFKVQRLAMINGASPGGSGAAIFKPSGGPWQAVNLEVVNVDFSNNHAIQVEQDGGGGAIYAIGMDQVLISNANFTGNSGSNGGAVYSLGSRYVRITDSEFDGNSATGNGGNPGNGGNAGAIGVDGAERVFNLCRSQLINNTANAHGVGFFSVMYDDLSLSAFTDVQFTNNHNTGNLGHGAGAYIQGGPFNINRSGFVNNSAPGVGALFVGPDASGFILNSTFYGNQTTQGLGGAMGISDSSQVDMRHLTVLHNQAPCSVCFVGGIQVGASNQVTLHNSILAFNTGGNEFNPWNIRNPVGGGNNVQFPQQRPNGQNEVPATAALIWADPLASVVGDNGGYSLTAAIDPNGPGVNQGNVQVALPIDQRGLPRHLVADIGAYEVLQDFIFAQGFE